MELLKNAWASLISGLQERTTNPLTFAFLFSWACWNFKFFVILFGDGTSSARISAIENLYPHQLDTYLGGAVLYPAATAVAYVFFYPYISKKAIQFSRAKQIEITNEVKKIEGARLLSREEAARLTRRHEAERNIFIRDSEMLSQQIQELREALAQSEERVKETEKQRVSALPSPSEKESQVSRAPHPHGEKIESEAGTSLEQESVSDLPSIASQIRFSDLSAEQAEIVAHLSDSPLGRPTHEISMSMNRNFTLTLVDLEDLQERGIVINGPGERWALTAEGRRMVAKILREGERSK